MPLCHRERKQVRVYPYVKTADGPMAPRTTGVYLIPLPSFVPSAEIVLM